MRPTLDAYLMSLAEVASLRTTCIKRAVGCVLADEKGRVLAIAYNGVASGVAHCNEVADCGHMFPLDLSAMPEAYLEKMLRGSPHVKREDVTYFRLEPTPSGHHRGGMATCLKFGWAQHACKGHSLPSGQDSCEAVHAEQNAILQCSDPDRIATAYVTTSPCKPCMKLLLNTGCRRIVFREEHTDPWPREQWLKAGRAWEKL